MGKMLKMQMLEDEDDLAYETEKKERTSSTSDAQPTWMRTLHTTACNWLQLMPQTVNPLKRTVENIKVMAGLWRKAVGKQPKRSQTADQFWFFSTLWSKMNKIQAWMSEDEYELFMCLCPNVFVQTHKHQDPLFRFFEREVKMGGKMLQEVRQDLSDVVQVCEGKKKQTNYLRTLISDLVKG